MLPFKLFLILEIANGEHQETHQTSLLDEAHIFTLKNIFFSSGDVLDDTGMMIDPNAF